MPAPDWGPEAGKRRGFYGRAKGKTLRAHHARLVADLLPRLEVNAAALAKVAVTAEVVGAVKGPKIRILKYKNKTGYRKRQGHRQGLTQLRVTGIETGQG